MRTVKLPTCCKVFFAPWLAFSRIITSGCAIVMRQIRFFSVCHVLSYIFQKILLWNNRFQWIARALRRRFLGYTCLGLLKQVNTIKAFLLQILSTALLHVLHLLQTLRLTSFQIERAAKGSPSAGAEPPPAHWQTRYWKRSPDRLTASELHRSQVSYAPLCSPSPYKAVAIIGYYLHNKHNYF